MSDITPKVRTLFGLYGALITLLVIGAIAALMRFYVYAGLVFGSLGVLWIYMVKIGRELEGDKE